MRRVSSGLAAVVFVAFFAGFPAFVGAAARKHGSRATVAITKQPVAVGTGGAVASMDVSASNAGVQVLKRGGNAIDAAVATASTLGDTIPFVAGPGGGG